jgi:hypothetical protein
MIRPRRPKAIIHRTADERRRVVQAGITFPTPGKYRVVLDVYPASGPAPNFQLLTA